MSTCCDVDSCPKKTTFCVCLNPAALNFFTWHGGGAITPGPEKAGAGLTRTASRPLRARMRALLVECLLRASLSPSSTRKGPICRIFRAAFISHTAAVTATIPGRFFLTGFGPQNPAPPNCASFFAQPHPRTNGGAGFFVGLAHAPG